MNVSLLFSLILTSAFHLTSSKTALPVSTSKGGGACLEAAANSLLEQISKGSYTDAVCEGLDDGISLPDGRSQALVKLTWNANSPQPGSYWLKGNFILGSACQNVQWQTLEHSPNLKSVRVNSTIQVQGFEPNKGMGLGRRPVRLTSNLPNAARKND